MKKDNNELKSVQPYTGKTYAYVGIALTVASAISIALIFSVLKIYALIASILLAIGALAFTGIQKRKNNFRQLKIINVCAYIVLGIATAVFVGGIIISAA